jgi:hypothetical protein
MGLGGFALCYRATLLRGTSDEAANAVPLDAIVAAGPDFRTPLQVATAARWNAISGGVTWPVNRTEASFVSGSGTVTVPALGIPAGVLPRLHGWRSGDGSASLPALARRLRPSSTVRTDGPALPAAASILAITTVGSSVSATLEADLRDGRGDIRRVALGETGANGPRTLEARVPATPHGPWTLEALVFGEPAGLQSTGGHQNAENPAAGGAQTGTIRVGPLTTLDAARRPLERVDLSGWRAVGAAAVAHGAAAAGSPAARPGALDLRFSETGSVGVARPAQPSDTHPVPVLVDAATASAAGPGGSLGLTVNGEPVSARVAGVLKRFPTVPDGSAGFVVADQATLASALDAQLPGQGSANEIWISTRDPSRVRQALGAGPFTQLRGSFRGSVEQLLRAAPVARAVAGTLIAAAGLSAVLAIVGLLFAMLGGARSRVAERDLVTQGIGPRGLRRELRVRLGVAGASGVIAGLLIALLLTRLAVATVRAAGTLATPQPPLITVTPADQLALWAIAGLVALGAAAFIATLATGRRP